MPWPTPQSCGNKQPTRTSRGYHHQPGYHNQQSGCINIITNIQRHLSIITATPSQAGEHQDQHSRVMWVPTVPTSQHNMTNIGESGEYPRQLCRGIWITQPTWQSDMTMTTTNVRDDCEYQCSQNHRMTEIPPTTLRQSHRALLHGD